MMVACGDEVVVATAHNAIAADDAVAANDAVAAVAVWVQRCLIRPCTILQFDFVSMVVTPTGKEPSWGGR